MARIRSLAALLAATLLTACTALPTAPLRAAAPAPEPVPAPELAPVAVWETRAPAPPPRPADLWDRLRAGYALGDIDHPRVLQQRSWYARHPAYMDRVVERAERYLHHVVSETERRGLPTELALLPVVESAFDPYAYSHGRAAGLWQFIPETGRLYGLDQDWWHDERRDVIESTRAALDHLEDLHDMFDGDWLLALAAYNSGAGNVRKALRRNRAAGASLDFFSLDLPRETEAYVPKLLAIAQLVEEPAAYGWSLRSLPDQPYFELVDIGGQLDLARAATLAELDSTELYLLNPGLNRWATHPEGPHRLLVPRASAAALRAGVETLPPEARVTWKRHRIKPGEAISTIASRYGTSVGALQSANRLKGSRIRAGDVLLIPVAAAPETQYALTATQRQARRDHRNADRGRELRYRVRSGDSFWSIAKAHGVRTQDVATWNGLATRDLLRVGQELVLWLPGGEARASTVSMPTPPARDPVVRRLGYQVRSGDSLARIADRFKVTVGDIVSWNALNPTAYLQPGQRLTLFVQVTGVP
jgi:membrane-bound lytic murein transglycosylase D